MRHFRMLRCVGLVLLGWTLVAQTMGPVERVVKVHFDGNIADTVKLYDKLNQFGRERNLRFVVAEDYEFRIATVSGRDRVTDMLSGAGAEAKAAVLTPDCKLLFIVARAGRLTQSGALNALAKEIVKQLSFHLKAQEIRQAK